MKLDFSPEQLADPEIAEAAQILRKCVHCGFCTATCPTYVLMGDELDSPRGRIYLIKDMLEHPERPPSETHVRHIDRCLGCLSCMTTCPSGVDYNHLVDQARAYISRHYRRPLLDRSLRALLGFLLPRPALFRLALAGAGLARLGLGLLPAILRDRLAPMLALAPRDLPGPSPAGRPQVFPAYGSRRMRVGLLAGCAQSVLAPGINEAAIRLLTRHGAEVVIVGGAGCCGALNQHLGQEAPAIALARRNVAAWTAEAERGGLDRIVITASGCGTLVKDYGHLLAGEPAWAAKAARVGAMTRDITEVMTELGLQAPARPTGQVVAYHSACSMQHGQQLKRQPLDLLTAAGFQVREVPEGHLCCGSAGTYNLLQPEIADQLKTRKLANIATTRPELIAAGNIGCLTQIASGTGVPVVHTAELLDWATGGPRPAAMPEAPETADVAADRLVEAAG